MHPANNMIPVVKTDIDFLESLHEFFLRSDISSRVSFFGTRIVERADGLQSYSIHNLTARILKIARDQDSVHLMPPEAREAGRFVTRKMDGLYSETDTLIKSRNVFTQALAWIQDFFYDFIGQQRFYLSDFVGDRFDIIVSRP